MTIRLRQFGWGAAACLGISLLGFARLASGQDFFDSVADPEGQGRFSEWFGGFDDRHFSRTERRGWIDHAEHGWLYVAGRGFGQGIWLRDHIWQRWWWTRRDVYPFLYHHESEVWWYYGRGGTSAGRDFFDYGEEGDVEQGQWRRVNQFGMRPDPFSEAEDAFWWGEFEVRDSYDFRDKKGWIDHAEHGAVYVRGGNFEAGFWYFDSILDEWLWTDAEGYPFVFSDRREAWLFYRRGGSPESREFFDYSEGEDGAWITVPPEEEEGDSER